MSVYVCECVCVHELFAAVVEVVAAVVEVGGEEGEEVVA